MEQPIAVRFDEPIIVPDMTRAEAERAEAEIISTGSRLRALLVDFYERRGWMALGYQSWRAWAVAALGDSQARVYQELTAGLIERQISTMVEIGTIPERHLRPLAPLRADPELLRDAWDEAHHIAAERGEKLTARHVEETVKAFTAPEVYPQEAVAYEPPVSRFNEGMRSSESAEWYTPAHIIEAARQVLGTIDCDPASSTAAQRTIGAAEWFGLDHPDPRNRDGLVRDWYGNVWMNPPYGDVIGEWVARLHQQHRAANASEALALLPARLDTAWWHDNLASYPFCVLRGRLKFSGAENSAPFPSVVVYLGSAPGVFAHAFRDLGLVYRPA